MSVESYRESPGKFDSRTLSRETLSRWTGRMNIAAQMAFQSFDKLGEPEKIRRALSLIVLRRNLLLFLLLYVCIVVINIIIISKPHDFVLVLPRECAGRHRSGNSRRRAESKPYKPEPLTQTSNMTQTNNIPHNTNKQSHKKGNHDFCKPMLKSCEQRRAGGFLVSPRPQALIGWSNQHFNHLHFNNLHFNNLHFNNLHFNNLHFNILGWSNHHFNNLHFKLSPETSNTQQ